MLFDGESNLRYLTTDLEVFDRYEFANQTLPLAEGPMFDLAKKLSRAKQQQPRLNQFIKLSVVSARSEKSMSRVKHSSKHFKLAIDEFIACDGRSKTPYLIENEAHLFFDDELANVQSAAAALPSCQVLQPVAF